MTARRSSAGSGRGTAFRSRRSLEGAIFAMTAEQATAHGAGRTDAGVHALGQVAHVDLERDWAPFRLSEGLNALLQPHPVAVLGVERVSEDFDARHSASARHYRYRIVNRRAPLTFERGQAWRVKPRLDAAAMHAAARVLIGRARLLHLPRFAVPGEIAGPHPRPARRQARRRRGSVRGERALIPASPGALDGGLAGRGRDGALERGGVPGGVQGRRSQPLRAGGARARPLSGEGGLSEARCYPPSRMRGRTGAELAGSTGDPRAK